MGKTAPIVSVITACFNHGKYIDEAVGSVLGQSFQDFEIIIVNDGSTDEYTNKLLKEYNKPKTSVIHTENKGPSAARNTAIRIAKGKYILPLDADDKIGGEYLEKAVAVLANDETVGIVYCEAEFFGGERSGKWNLPEYTFSKILLGNVIFSSGFFRRADWESVGGYDEGMLNGWEDYDFWLSLIEKGRKIHRIQKVLFYYRLLDCGKTLSLTKGDRSELFAKIFSNHEKLYSDHISFVFARILELEEDYSNLTGRLESLEQDHKQLQQEHGQLQNSQAMVIAREFRKYPFLMSLAKLGFESLGIMRKVVNLRKRARGK